MSLVKRQYGSGGERVKGKGSERRVKKDCNQINENSFEQHMERISLVMIFAVCYTT